MKRESKAALEQYLKKLELIRSESTVNPFETRDEQRTGIELARTDVEACVRRYFPHYASAESADFHIEFAERVKHDRTLKAFAEWFRGAAKSVWCDVIIPFWLWINDEAHYLVLIGQNDDKASQLLDDLKAEFEVNPQIIKDFGEQKREGKWETGDFMTRGCREWGLKPFICRALGMGMEVRGLRIGSQRPDLCICDDLETRELIKNPKRQDEYANWIKTALLPTMDGPVRRFLYANNKFAVRMIQTELQRLHPTWWVQHIKAYDKATMLPRWHQKYPPSYYRDLERELGIIVLQQEYLMEPKIEGKIFKPEQLIWDKPPRLDHFKIIVGHWDIAYAGTSTSDYNAVRIWGLCKEDLFWYLRSFVKQTKMREAVAYICDVQKSLPPGVIIHWQYEAQFWNDEVERTIKEVSKEKKVKLLISKVSTPRTKKYDRMLTMQPRYQNNRIRHNKAMEADNDTQVGNAQLFALEPGYSSHDDAPDGDEQCIAFLEKHISIGSDNDSEFETGRMIPHNEAI